MPVGGVRDKVLAAHHADIKHVILPARNKADLEELPAEVREVRRVAYVMCVFELVSGWLSRRG